MERQMTSSTKAVSRAPWRFSTRVQAAADRARLVGATFEVSADTACPNGDCPQGKDCLIMRLDRAQIPTLRTPVCERCQTPLITRNLHVS